MITILLQTHITFMIISLVLTTVGISAVSFGKKLSKTSMHANLAATAIGVSSGALLLIDNPLSIRCVVLATYVLVFLVAYRFMTIRTRQLATNH